METAGPAKPDARPQHGFSLQLLLAVVAAVSVSLAVARYSPWLGIPLAIVLAPAMVRTSLIMKKRRAAKLPVYPEVRVAEFFASVFVMTLTLVASSVAFCCACFPVGMMFFNLRSGQSTAGMCWAFGLGFLAAGAVAFFLLRGLWPSPWWPHRPRAAPRATPVDSVSGNSSPTGEPPAETTP